MHAAEEKKKALDALNEIGRFARAGTRMADKPLDDALALIGSHLQPPPLPREVEEAYEELNSNLKDAFSMHPEIQICSSDIVLVGNKNIRKRVDPFGYLYRSLLLVEKITAAQSQGEEVSVEEVMRGFEYYANVDEGTAFAPINPAYRESDIKHLLSQYKIVRKA